MSDGQDQTERLAESVREARSAGQPMRILGTGSKSFLLPEHEAAGDRLLSVVEHEGVVEYRPDELVITVRAGTPLKRLRQLFPDSSLQPPNFPGRLDCKSQKRVDRRIESAEPGPGPDCRICLPAVYQVQRNSTTSLLSTCL